MSITQHLLSGELHWLPDEICFSLVARYHVATVHRRARDSCLELFGHATAGARHDFTGQLAELSTRAEGALGSGRDIAFEHTLLRFYLPLQTPTFGAHAIDTLQGHDLSKLKSELGLPSSRFRAHHPLKACESCMAADHRRWGVGYWHLQHQSPGAWWCTEHQEPLLQLPLKTNGIERFLLHLPRREELFNRPDLAEPKSCGHGLEFALLANDLASEPLGRTLPRDALATVYGNELERRFGVARIHAPTANVVIADFQRVMSELRHLPEFSPLPTEFLAAPALLRRLLQPRSNSHPLWHLVMTYWLFGSWARLSAEVDAQTLLIEPAEQAEAQSRSEAGDTDEMLTMRQAGMSVRAIARSLHIDHKTASSWLAQRGIATPRRAKLLKGDVRRRALTALENGTDKDQVAQEAGVSVGTVTQLLRSEPKLHDRWRAARYEIQQRRAREAWLRALQHAIPNGVKLARSQAAAAYAWLYRNDREWLSVHTSQLQRCARNRYAAQWTERDEQACFEVLESIQALPVDLPHRARMRSLMRACPTLERYRGSLHELPLTSDILAAFTGAKVPRTPR